MIDNEKELINLFCGNDNPEWALTVAAVVIINFLKQLESSE